MAARAHLATEFARQLARIPPVRGTQRRRPRAVPELHERAARSDVRGADPLRRWTSSSGTAPSSISLRHYTFVNPVLARHYGMPEPAAGTLGARGRCAEVRARRAAADVGVPDQERARPAHQPGQARLLGRPPAARRVHPRAAAQRPGPADRRDQARRPDAARNARPAPRESRAAPAATRSSTRSASSSKATVRSARRAIGIWRDGRSKPPPRSPTARRAPGSRGCARSCAHEGRVNSSTTCAASSSSMPWAAACCDRTSRSSPRCARTRDRRLQVRPPGSGHRHQPAVPDETRDAQLREDLHHEASRPARCSATRVNCPGAAFFAAPAS